MEQAETIAYKTWVENLQEPAPEGAWDSIADQLDIDATWDSITETLDLDDVWRNIETELPATAPVSGQVHFPKLLWVAAALVLFTLTTPLEDHTPVVNKQNEVSQINAETKITDRVDTDNAISSESKPDGANGIANGQQEGFQNTASVTDTNKSARISEKLSLPNAQDSDLSKQPIIIQTDSGVTVRGGLIFSEEKSGRVERIAILEQQDTLTRVEKTIEKDSIFIVANVEQPKDSVQQKQFERAKWQVGIIGSLKNTWLINPETADGLKRSSLNDTQITFGKEFGITLQRSIGGASALQFEYYFYSEIGQRYHEYINALYQTKDVKLRYQKFQLVYRTRLWKNLNTPALYAVGGIRVSRLTLADTEIGNENQVVTQEYRPWDYGFILGGEAEFKLTRKLILVSGLRASYGLRNIYLGNGLAPAEFNKTHTASVGVALGLKYKIN